MTTRSRGFSEGSGREDLLEDSARWSRNVRTIERIVRTIANRANISRKVSPHVLRHTFSVTAVQKGISLPALQRLLGHDHLATTEIYLNLSAEHVIKEFIDK